MFVFVMLRVITMAKKIQNMIEKLSLLALLKTHGGRFFFICCIIILSQSTVLLVSQKNHLYPLNAYVFDVLAWKSPHECML